MLRKILSLPDISNWCSERPTGNGFYYHVRYVLYLIKLSYYSKKWRNCEVSYFIQRTGTRLRTLIFQSNISSNKSNRTAYMQIRCSYLVFCFLNSKDRCCCIIIVRIQKLRCQLVSRCVCRSITEYSQHVEYPLTKETNSS